MLSAVVLLSGGLDSATVAAIAKDKGFSIHALTVDYGQRHRVELEAARRVASVLGAAEHRVVQVNLNAIGGSALTDTAIAVPKDATNQGEIPVTYVPARNAIFLSIALGYAEVIGAQDIFIGANAVDYSGYPDCRQPFLDAFAAVARVGTKAGVEGRPWTIHAPLIDLTKVDIIRQGLRLGLDYGLTHSCYDPDSRGCPCLRCDACRIRARAFAELGMPDPVTVHA
jgi:7-cyano-7-deazaguanine synthase